MKLIVLVLNFLISISLTAQFQAQFTNIAQTAGLTSISKNYGVSFADYDNDGDEDIFIARQSQANILYQNNNDGTFTDVTEAAGLAFTGVCNTGIWGDLDNDGDLDLYIGNRILDNILYENNGDGTFTDITATAGVPGDGRAKTVMFGDIDDDGFLDIYVANPSHDNQLYYNHGDMTFTNEVVERNANDTKISMGSVFFDYDVDGDLDLYLTHDADQANILYNNDGTGHFTDVSAFSNTDYEGNGMGVDVGDVNNDGLMDIYITNLSYNTLLLNEGDGTFSDISFLAGVIDPGMGWGTVIFDYDNDTWQDIYLTNDSYFAPTPNVLYKNLGNNTFQNVSFNTPLASMFAGYGVATADLNRDGWLDMVLANNGSQDAIEFFQNDNQNDNHWVQFKLESTTGNRSAIGARVEVRCEGQLFVDEVIAGSGYSSQNSLTLHFGLAAYDLIDSLTIRWSSGNVSVFERIATDTLYTIIENETKIPAVPIPSIEQPIPSIEQSISSIEQIESVGFFLISPNPFSTEVQIPLLLSKSQVIQLDIINLNGQMVKNLSKGKLNADEHVFIWNGRDDSGHSVSKGIYYCRLMTETGIAVQKLIKM